MSEKPEKVEVKKIDNEDDDEEVEETTVTTSATTRKGPLGFNFNDPIVLAATVLGVSVIGIVGYNLVRNFIWAAAPPQPTQPQQQKPANVTVTPEQLRQAQYQRDLEMASHNLFATNMNTIETNNKQLKQDGVHYYDQFFNQYERKPAETTTFEDDIMIVDDNNEPIVTVSNQKQTYYKPAPPTVQVNRPTFNTRPPPQPMQKIESQEVINDEDITMITSNEPDLDKIPKEFVSVGNSETEFDRIEAPQQQQQRAPHMQQNQRKSQPQQEVDFENLEIDSDTLKQMEANAYTNSDNYY